MRRTQMHLFSFIVNLFSPGATTQSLGIGFVMVVKGVTEASWTLVA